MCSLLVAPKGKNRATAQEGIARDDADRVLTKDPDSCSIYVATAPFAVSFATATVSAMRDPAGTRAVEEINSASAWSASPSYLRAWR